MDPTTIQGVPQVEDKEATQVIIITEEGVWRSHNKGERRSLLQSKSPGEWGMETLVPNVCPRLYGEEIRKERQEDVEEVKEKRKRET